MTAKDGKAFVARYIPVDSHLNERNGSTKQVYGIAGERPAGRKLADDIARYCNQLDEEGYEVIWFSPSPVDALRRCRRKPLNAWKDEPTATACRRRMRKLITSTPAWATA